MSRAKRFVAPKVSVTAITPGERFDTIAVVGLLHPYGPPFAPAGLYDLRTERQEAAQLHKLASSDGTRHTFHTFPPHRVSRSLLGRRFVYRSWWTADQLQLVTDTSLGWHRRRYPTDGDHVHCALTWQTISAPIEAYECRGDWITIEAYEKVYSR
jgi:hypothetical protein